MFVGVLDVLGFKTEMGTHGLGDILDRYRRLKQMKIDASRVPVVGPGSLDIEVSGTTIFSDSIILWCDDSIGGFQTLLTTCCSLISEALQTDWMLRGGIAFGDCVLDRGSRVFVGQPIIDAHLLETNQEWCGGSLHQSVLASAEVRDHLDKLDDLISYAVPLKDPKCQAIKALHWGPYAYRAKSILTRRLGSAPAGPPKTKIQNTLDYLESTCVGFAALT